MPYALFAEPGLPDRDQCLALRRGLRAGGRRRRRQAKARGRLQHQAVRAGPGPGRGTGLGPEPAKNLTCAGTKPAPRSYLGKCSNLVRGESMKDPVSIFGCWRGFSIWGLRGSTR